MRTPGSRPNASTAKVAAAMAMTRVEVAVDTSGSAGSIERGRTFHAGRGWGQEDDQRGSRHPSCRHRRPRRRHVRHLTAIPQLLRYGVAMNQPVLLLALVFGAIIAVGCLLVLMHDLLERAL